MANNTAGATLRRAGDLRPSLKSGRKPYLQVRSHYADNSAHESQAALLTIPHTSTYATLNC
jgi:hypothetical protein